MAKLSASLSEVRLVTVGVSDLDRSVAFYRDGLGYHCVERGQIGPELAELWCFEPTCLLHYAILAADDSGRGRLRLIAGQPPGPRIWGDSDRLSCTGAYALNFRCRDIHRQLDSIRQAGGQAAENAHFWEVNDEVHVFDSMSSDPDGIQLDLFSYRRGGDLRGPLDTPVSVVQTVALAVADVGISRAFYGALGFRTLFDRILDFDGLGEMLGLDRRVRIHNVNLMKDGQVVPGRVEMFAFLDEDLPRPHPISTRVRPPNVGILSLSLLTTAMDQVIETMLASGGRLLVHCPAISLPGIGNSRAAASLLGPDGEQIELAEVERLPND